MPCGNDECQVDSDCGPGCRCLYDPGGNYCFCSGNGGGGGGNNPPTCTINGPTNITYDAKRYWDANKTLRTQNPTEHRLSLTLSDPDGDAVSVTNVTVDRNCLTSRRAGNDVYVTPQGQVTGVTPTLTGTNSCDVQVGSGQWAVGGRWSMVVGRSLIRIFANPLKDTQFVYAGVEEAASPPLNSSLLMGALVFCALQRGLLTL